MIECSFGLAVDDIVFEPDAEFYIPAVNWFLLQCLTIATGSIRERQEAERQIRVFQERCDEDGDYSLFVERLAAKLQKRTGDYIP